MATEEKFEVGQWYTSYGKNIRVTQRTDRSIRCVDEAGQEYRRPIVPTTLLGMGKNVFVESIKIRGLGNLQFYATDRCD